MTVDFTQRGYWDRAAATKTFTHPLDLALVAKHVAGPHAQILDYGCGQGRLCGELREAGYSKVSGVDFSAEMIERARVAQPGMHFAVIEESGPAMPAGSIDCVLLFAVLTCIPDDISQHAVVGQLTRLLKTGGIVYLSDYLVQSDTRNTARYEQGVATGNPFGVFMTDDQARVRHHGADWLGELFSGFRKLEDRVFEVTTMNGHTSSGFQWVLRK